MGLGTKFLWWEGRRLPWSQSHGNPLTKADLAMTMAECPNCQLQRPRLSPQYGTTAETDQPAARGQLIKLDFVHCHDIHTALLLMQKLTSQQKKRDSGPASIEPTRLTTASIMLKLVEWWAQFQYPLRAILQSWVPPEGCICSE